jgi:hypothetical protein
MMMINTKFRSNLIILMKKIIKIIENLIKKVLEE